MDKLKFIKTIVFIITFLLVLGSISLLGIVYKKITQQNTVKETKLNLEQEIGSEISSFAVEDGNIYLLIRNGSQSDKIMIIHDQAKTLEEIRLN